MSHFTVLVIGDDHEAALAPFQENNMGDCPREYMAFHDLEDEYREEYENEARDMIVLADGSRHSPYDDRFRNPAYSPFKFEDRQEQWLYPADSTRKEFPHKELYASLEEFARDWHGSGARDSEKGRFGYWENPNKKWDWYQVGGRWSGLLKLKPGAQGLTGERGLMGSHFAEGADRTDQARKGDIDWDGLRDEAEAKAREKWKHANAITGGERWHSWEHVREVLHKGNINAAREFYHAQPAVKKLKETDHERYGWDMDDTLCWSLDNYIQRARNGAGSTFAVIKDGKWYQRGEMGWWGAVSDEKNTDDWHKEFAALIDSLPDDTMLTVVDCHI